MDCGNNLQDRSSRRVLMALVCIGLGDKDQAFEWFERVVSNEIWGWFGSKSSDGR